MTELNSASLNEIPHWVCIGCGAIQPKPASDPYPEMCWRCEHTEFIRDAIKHPQSEAQR